jgi:hypothetical protein
MCHSGTMSSVNLVVLVELAAQRIGPGRVIRRPGQQVERRDDADVRYVRCVRAA